MYTAQASRASANMVGEAAAEARRNPLRRIEGRRPCRTDGLACFAAASRYTWDQPRKAASTTAFTVSRPRLFPTKKRSKNSGPGGGHGVLGHGGSPPDSGWGDGGMGEERKEGIERSGRAHPVRGATSRSRAGALGGVAASVNAGDSARRGRRSPFREGDQEQADDHGDFTVRRRHTAAV